ncbi:hypothetical protein [Sphingopyxis yananensis]|uniref:hypothetical protein n=1 Tax=Sphingopyxis yananensis TaxID=2886687 RepID=UPI001D10CC46|nr:hypothetical protein [Sphingopyxis yananensis]MCC2601534.1 hypothetical protein [Sphingopyxis yananensis]
MANYDYPETDNDRSNDEGKCEMPCVIQETREAGDFICEGPAPRRPESSAVFAAQPHETGAKGIASDYFHSALAFVAAIVLLLGGTICANFALGVIENSAQRGYVALSQGLGHLANYDYPETDNDRSALSSASLG